MALYISQLSLIAACWTVTLLLSLSFSAIMLKSWIGTALISLTVDIIFLPLAKALIDSLRSKSEDVDHDYHIYVKPRFSRPKSKTGKKSGKVTLKTRVLFPEQEEKAIENIVARKKWKQRLSLEETVLDIGGYIA